MNSALAITSASVTVVPKQSQLFQPIGGRAPTSDVFTPAVVPVSAVGTSPSPIEVGTTSSSETADEPSIIDTIYRSRPRAQGARQAGRTLMKPPLGGHVCSDLGFGGDGDWGAVPVPVRTCVSRRYRPLGGREISPKPRFTVARRLPMEGPPVRLRNGCQRRPVDKGVPGTRVDPSQSAARRGEYVGNGWPLRAPPVHQGPQLRRTKVLVRGDSP